MGNLKMKSPKKKLLISFKKTFALSALPTLLFIITLDSGHASQEEQKKYVDVLIEPDVKELPSFGFDLSEDLIAEGYRTAMKKSFQLDSLEALCDTLGVFVQVVPRGTEIVPPTQNVQFMGQHNPKLKDEKYHLDYIFDMFELEADELGLLATEVGSWE